MENNDKGKKIAKQQGEIKIKKQGVQKSGNTKSLKSNKENVQNDEDTLFFTDFKKSDKSEKTAVKSVSGDKMSKEKVQNDIKSSDDKIKKQGVQKSGDTICLKSSEHDVQKNSNTLFFDDSKKNIDEEIKALKNPKGLKQNKKNAIDNRYKLQIAESQEIFEDIKDELKEDDENAENALTDEDLKKIDRAKRKHKFSMANATRYKPKINIGLTKQEVLERIENGYVNITHDKNKKTILGIVLKNLLTFFNLLCAIVAIALICVGAFDNIFFMVIIVANILIGIIQEIRAKKTIDKISLVTAPSVVIIRDGVKKNIQTNAIVLDDILEFDVGRQISADCIVLAGEVEVNESLLTGESVPVKKNKGDMLLAGSFISSGNCVARADKVGDECYSAQLAAKAKQYKKPQSEILKSLKIIITVIGIIIIPLGCFMLLNNYAQLGGGTNVESIKRTAGSIIGMIPAGMFLLTSMALAVGVIKLASKRTLVQDLYSIEMLSRTTVLCLDKTGTITDGTMKVTDTLITNNKTTKDEIANILSSMLGALNDNNSTSQALIAYFGNTGNLKSTKILPFNSTRKCSAVTFSGNTTYVLGAPEFVLNAIDPILQKSMDLYTLDGQRVIVLAKGRGKIEKDSLPQVVPIAVIAIEDRIRVDAKETIEWFKQNDVAIKIISGDNPITVSEISKKVGVPNAEKYINLHGLSDKQVIEAVNEYAVFGRVTPEQKSIIVKALKQNGHKVAMTGDGVNDILALKEADCSIAMASGSDATRHVSNLVLLDSNFSSMPSIVAEGRRVVNNITKSSSLFLMKTLFTILLSVFCLSISLSYPFSPNDVLLLEMFAIGIPSFFLALQPNKEPIRGNFLVNLLTKSLPGGVLLFLSVLACYFFDTKFADGLSYETMASIAISFAGLILLIRVCRPLDFYRTVLFLSMVLLTSVTLLIVPSSFFGYTNLNMVSTLFIIIVVEFGFLWLIRPIFPQKDYSFKLRREMKISQTGIKTAENEKSIKEFINNKV